MDQEYETLRALSEQVKKVFVGLTPDAPGRKAELSK